MFLAVRLRCLVSFRVGAKKRESVMETEGHWMFGSVFVTLANRSVTGEKTRGSGVLSTSIAFAVSERKIIQ